MEYLPLCGILSFNRYSLIVPHNKKAKINRSHFVCYLFDFCHHLCLLRNLLHYP